jgi:hypothetical protein
MFVAATGVVKIHPAIVGKVEVGIDDGIAWVEDGFIRKFLERTCRTIAHCHTNAEYLALVGGILFPVRGEQHIELSITLIYLRRPEAIGSPTVRVGLVALTVKGPVGEVVTHIYIEAVHIALSGAIGIELAIAGMKDEGITHHHGLAIGQGERIAYLNGRIRWFILAHG